VSDHHQEAVREAEERLLNAWPSLRTMMCNGWALRVSGGYTKRSNSACAIAPDGEFRATLAQVERIYAACGLPPIFRLSPLAEPDADSMLERSGYARLDETIVMEMPLRGCPSAPPGATIETRPTEEWEAFFARAHHLTKIECGGHRAILERIAPLATAYALVRHDGDAIACGLGVLEHESIGLFDIVTLPAARRKGAARGIVAGLLAWSIAQGAQRAWLGVIADNVNALALYEQFGFRELYRYHYRAARVDLGS